MRSICDEEDLDQIVSGTAVDTSFKVAVLLSKKLGWTVRYLVRKDNVGMFTLVVPVVPEQVKEIPQDGDKEQELNEEEALFKEEDTRESVGLLVGCSQYEKLFAKDLRLKCDFVKAQEAKSLLAAKNYKFAIVDLDDPTVDLPKIANEKGNSAVKFFATSSSNSERI